MVLVGGSGIEAYSSKALAQRAYKQAIIKLQRMRTDLLRQYGYTADFDVQMTKQVKNSKGQITGTKQLKVPQGTGEYTGLRVDAQNPYGLFQLQRRQHAMEHGGLQEQMIERGLKGGLAAQNQNALNFVHGGRRADLGQSLITQLADYLEQQRSAAIDYEMALINAERAKAAMRAQSMSNIPHPSPSPAPTTAPDYPPHFVQPDPGMPTHHVPNAATQPQTRTVAPQPAPQQRVFAPAPVQAPQQMQQPNPQQQQRVNPLQQDNYSRMNHPQLYGR